MKPEFVRAGRYIFDRLIKDNEGHSWDLRLPDLSYAQAIDVARDPRLHVCVAECGAVLSWAADPRAAWHYMATRTHFGDIDTPPAGAVYQVSWWTGPEGSLLLFEDLY